MSECGYAEETEGCVVGIGHATVFLDDCDSCLHMVEHQAEVLLLLYDLMPFLVEDVAQTVQSPVEPSSSEAFFVESKVKFLVLKGIEHIGYLSSHLSRGQKRGDDGGYCRCRKYDEYDGQVAHCSDPRSCRG